MEKELKSTTYEDCFQVNGGCEVVGIFGVCSISKSKTSNRKSLSINTWKFHLRQIIRTEGGVKCEVVFWRITETNP